MDKIFKGKNIIVYDDILTDKEKDFFEDKFYYKKIIRYEGLPNEEKFINEFPWYVRQETLTVHKDTYKIMKKNNPEVHDGGFMVHEFYKVDDNDETKMLSSSRFNLINMLLEKIMIYFDIDKLPLIRAKANLQHPLFENKKEWFNSPHIDFNQEHWVCIYYVNDSDGDTIFFDEIPVRGEEYHKAIDKKLTVQKRVSPIKGRFVFFNGNILHTGQHPMNSHCRIAVNMDFNK